jgi:hypothetical protein
MCFMSLIKFSSSRRRDRCCGWFVNNMRAALSPTLMSINGLQGVHSAWRGLTAKADQKMAQALDSRCPARQSPPFVCSFVRSLIIVGGNASPK